MRAFGLSTAPLSLLLFQGEPWLGGRQCQLPPCRHTSQKGSGSAKSPSWSSRFLQGNSIVHKHAALLRNTPTFSCTACIPISHLCHLGQNLCLSGVGLLPKIKSFSGNFSFLLHCLRTTARALQTWNTLSLKTSVDGRKVSPSSSWCWRNVLGWWQSWTQIPLHSHRTQAASGKWHLLWFPSLTQLSRALVAQERVEINSNYFYLPACCYTTHPSIRKRNIVVPLIPFQRHFK